MIQYMWNNLAVGNGLTDRINYQSFVFLLRTSFPG